MAGGQRKTARKEEELAAIHDASEGNGKDESDEQAEGKGKDGWIDRRREGGVRGVDGAGSVFTILGLSAISADACFSSEVYRLMWQPMTTLRTPP